MVEQLDREAVPYFSQPVSQILTMLTVLGMVGAGGYLALPIVGGVFLANPLLNGFICFVFIVGVLACFWQVAQLIASVQWIEGFVAQRPGHEFTRAPRLLAPLAALLRSRGKQMQIGASSSRSIQDSVATRIDEARDITRYIVNLLIFLGLLGTFWGLATTVPAIVDTIRSLAPEEGESGLSGVGRLMSGLESQLGGMGTAFSSSLLGLAGSLVVGLLELFAGHGQNRFYRELEEWLSTITRLSFASGDAEHGGEHSQAGVLYEQMDIMKDMLAESEASRVSMEDRMQALSDAIQSLSETQKPQESSVANNWAALETLERVAEGQERLISVLKQAQESGGAHVDAESRMRLRSIDVQLLRILEEITAGRQESVADLRAELAQVTHELRSLRGE